MEDNKMIITNKDGEKIEYEIITAFQIATTGKNYVVYTDNTNDENGNLNIYASIYYPEDDSKLETIKTKEEWDIVETVLANLKQQ